MNPIKIANQILSDYKNLIDKINNLPKYSLEPLLIEYKPLKENKEFDLLIFNKNDKYLSEEECGRITRIIQIVSDIDSAINEYNNSPCIDNLKAIIKSIRNTYNLG